MKVTNALVVALLLGSALPASAQAVRLEFLDGRVNLSAQNAPVRTILAEWARLGGTTIVNGERVPGAPVTIELAGVSERQAIDVLLRAAAGYIVGPRQIGSTAASTFASIMILPTSAVTNRQASTALPPPARVRQPERDPDPEPDPEEEPEIDQPPDVDDRPMPATIRRAVEEANRRRLADRRPQFFVGDEVVEQQEPETPRPPPATPGSNPFGVPQGAARPGIITPVPEQQDDRRRTTDQEP
jgi:hypothetical protein